MSAKTEVFAAQPGSVVPSISTVWAIVGRTLAGWITCKPAEAMSKPMGTTAAEAELASLIAWRSEPVPLSAVVVTSSRTSWSRPNSLVVWGTPLADNRVAVAVM